MRRKSFSLLKALSMRQRSLFEAKRLLPVAAVGNDRPGPALVQPLAQFGAVIRLVAEQAFW
jgi:hypothetical protein